MLFRRLSRMGGEAFVVKVSETDRTLLTPGTAGTIAKRSGRPAAAITVSYEPDFMGGGVVVEDAGGLEMWDNRLTERLSRLWPELRLRIAVKASFIREADRRGVSSDCRQRY